MVLAINILFIINMKMLSMLIGIILIKNKQ